MDSKFKSKEDLYEYLENNDLSGLDSEFSYRSRLLTEVFDAKGVDFNSWWIKTKVDWQCPSCARYKEEIVRINQHGDLTGHTHEHHDHVADVVEKQFIKISESKEKVVANLLSERFIERTAYALAAYDNTLICSDCNNADAKAKKAINAPADFSFSPAEIKSFIIVKPNQEHEICIESASKSWSECEAIFRLRMELVNQVAALAASNEHWYQPSEVTAKQQERFANHYFSYYGLKELDIFPEQLLYKSNKYTGSSDSWRVKRKLQKDKRPPTDGQLQHLAQLRGHNWNRLDDGWCCSGCDRTKLECVRKSNSNEWSFIVSTSKKLSNGIFALCNDCQTTATHFGKEIIEKTKQQVDFPSEVMSLSELKSIVQPTIHNKHNINNDVANNILNER